ncbi:hypothetical protein [Thiomicrorhabdus aquaedulcis]|uniref:hypothetical protein n=1 Tax=Thiomicrorhabdus aquaedulcis TaxID=2211106 RepID=UPI000FD89AB4|nr:hypothetical protein [Thiomicrorhabdus aquaedulcis]
MNARTALIFMPQLLLGTLATLLVGCGGQSPSSESTSSANTAEDNPTILVKQLALTGDFASPLNFDNPYAQVPAQCYIETSHGRQNACLFCHTNGLYNLGLGNNNPQAGAVPMVNFQIDYGFDPFSTTAPYASINRWENTLYPEQLAQHVAKLGVVTQEWDMQSYIRQNNWQTAYNQRPGSSKEWDSGYEHPLRLFPGLNPADLPADSDGFVRTKPNSNANNAFLTMAPAALPAGAPLTLCPTAFLRP